MASKVVAVPFDHGADLDLVAAGDPHDVRHALAALLGDGGLADRAPLAADEALEPDGLPLLARLDLAAERDRAAGTHLLLEELRVTSG